MRGYPGGYGDFSDQYWDKYYEYQSTGGGGGFGGSVGGGGFTISWETRYSFIEGKSEEIRDKDGTLLEIRLPGFGFGYIRGSITVGGNNPYNYGISGGEVNQTQGGSSLPSWPSWVNNVATVGAYGATVKGGSAGLLSSSGALRYYSNAWTGNQYIKTYNLSKVGTGIGYGTSFVGVGLGAVNFALSDRSWGDYGQLGMSFLSSGLTLSVYTAPVGIGIGFIDVTGGFNGFYNYLDNQQQFYNNTGGVMLPVNNIPTFIRLRRP